MIRIMLIIIIMIVVMIIMMTIIMVMAIWLRTSIELADIFTKILILKVIVIAGAFPIVKFLALVQHRVEVVTFYISLTSSGDWWKSTGFIF